MPGGALLGGFAALTWAVSLDAVLAAINDSSVARSQKATKKRPGPRSPRQGRAEALTVLKQIEGSRAVAEAVAMSART